MNEKLKIKENIFNKIGALISLHPIIASVVISFVSALYVSFLLLNFDKIIKPLNMVSVAAFIIPGALLCLFIGLYLGIVLHRNEIKESILDDKDFYFRLGSVVFSHSWKWDTKLNKFFPVVTGPCCPVCGEFFWEADSAEDDRLVFKCRKCDNINAVQLQDYEKIKSDAERTLEKAYERLEKFQDKFKHTGNRTSDLSSDKNE